VDHAGGKVYSGGPSHGGNEAPGSTGGAMQRQCHRSFVRELLHRTYLSHRNEQITTDSREQELFRMNFSTSPLGNTKGSSFNGEFKKHALPCTDDHSSKRFQDLIIEDKIAQIHQP